MKRNLLEIFVIMLVAVNLCSCLDIEIPKNDNTAFVGDWQLSHVLGTDYYTPTGTTTAVLDTLVDTEIPHGVRAMNLALDGTGTITQTEYKDGEYIDVKNDAFPITYSWFTNGLYAYLTISKRSEGLDYSAVYSINRIKADSLVYTSAGVREDTKEYHVITYRSTYTK